jgi:NADH:ubiquinone oxidoreductase subunit
MGKFAAKLKFLKFMVTGKRVVGTDKYGNTYYTMKTNNKERRFVDHVGGEEDWLVAELPVEWISWLQKVRQDAPTEEVSQALDRERNERMQNAIEWDKKEEIQYQEHLKNKLNEEQNRKLSQIRQKGSQVQKTSEENGESVEQHLQASLDAFNNKGKE